MKRMIPAAILAILLLTITFAACAEVTPMVRNGGSFVFAVDAKGVIWGWGDNRNGQLGYPKAGFIKTPTQVAEGLDGTKLVDIQCGNENTLYLMEDGTVWTSGTASHGTQGLGKLDKAVFAPRQITDLKDIVQISCGFGHNAVLDKDGHVWTWGRNSGGQVGNGTRQTANAPLMLELENIVKITCGGKFCLALDADGQLWGWGENSYGIFGKPKKKPYVTSPMKLEVADGVQIDQIAGGSDVGYILDAEGVLWSWGRNDYWQLGAGERLGDSQLELQQVSIPTKVVRIIGYSSHTMAVDEDRNVWVWGSVSAGQLGNGGSQCHIQPIITWGRGDVVDAAIGSLICSVLTDDGLVYVAGYNKYAQLGMNYPKTSRYWCNNGLNVLTGEIGDPVVIQ